MKHGCGLSVQLSERRGICLQALSIHRKEQKMELPARSGQHTHLLQQVRSKQENSLLFMQ